jgi:hypothetical protein
LKTGKLEQIRNRLDIPEKFFAVFLTISALWVAGCLLMLLPQVRSFAFGFGEFFLRQPLSALREKTGRWAVECLAAYLLFFFVFFHKKLFTGVNSGKKLYFFAIAVSAGVVFCIFHKINWTFGDDAEYITTTAINKYVPLKSPYFELGRFFPFGHIHYNIPLFFLRLFGIQNGLPLTVHFILPALFHLTTVFCLYVLFRNIEPFKNENHKAFNVFFVCTWMLMAKSFPRIYMGLSYPEAQLIMLFTVFMLMYYRALATDKKRYFIAALFCAIYAAYCKEPAFGVFMIIALVNHIFRYRRETKNEKTFYVALMTNGVLFLALYYFLSFRNAVGTFNAGVGERLGFGFFYSIIRDNAVFVIMFPLCLVRLFYLVFKKDREHLYYDSLLFAGTGYSFAYVLLRMNFDYYFLPSIVLFLPSLVYWMKYFYQKKTVCAVFLIVFLFLIYMFNINSAANRIKYIWKERQEFMSYIADLYSQYQSGDKFMWYEYDDASEESAIHKRVRDWRKRNLNAFLNYVNKSEGKDFFTAITNIDKLDSESNVLFFYETHRPLPDTIKEALNDKHFAPYRHPDNYSVLIYGRL